MIIQSYHPLVGGAEKQVEALCPLLKKLGVEVSVITRRYQGLKPKELVSGVPVYRMPIPGPKAVKALSFTFFAIFQLARLNPHVIHAHELLSPATTALVARRLMNIPVVVKVLRGGLLGDVAKLKKRFLGLNRLNSLRDRLDQFIVISNEIEAELIEQGFPTEKLNRIPNGVDTEKFSPCKGERKAALRESLGIKPGLVTVFTGRLSAEKKVDQLIKVWPQVRDRFSEAELLIIGEGEKGPELKRLAPRGVSFLGSVADVSPYLQAADLFVLPSSTEGLSNALLEAMSTGLPVVATSVGGAPDLIDHKENGWLISPDHITELEEAIVTILGNEQLRDKLGKQARAKMVSEYDLKQVASRLKDLYISLARKGEV
jgi:glycosyltransferase involved in cell wall biosynthesis